MAAEALARLHRTSDAAEQVQHLIRLRQTIESDPSLWLRQMRVRLCLKEVRLLEDDLRRCRQALNAAWQYDNLILLWTEEGRAWDDEDDLDRALACWEQSAHLMERAKGNPVANASGSLVCADLLMQLGRLEHLRGNLQAALDRYHEAMKHANLSSAHQLNIQLRILLVLMELNQLDQARGMARADTFPGALLSPPLPPWERGPGGEGGPPRRASRPGVPDRRAARPLATLASRGRDRRLAGDASA
jgi:tetratricopeptide (TPR) repeat protein